MSKANEVFVKCFKHDGSLHRVWRRSFLIENNENYFVIASKKAVVSEGNGRQWVAKEPAITIFPKNKWFNVIAMLKDPYVAYYVKFHGLWAHFTTSQWPVLSEPIRLRTPC